MKVLVLASYDRSLIAFRGELLETMVARGHEVAACAPDPSAEVRTELARRGIRCESLPMSRTGMNPFADLGTIFALVRRFRAEKPDRVLAYTVKVVLYAALAARIAGLSGVYSMITGLGFAFSDGSGIRRRVSSAIVHSLYRMARGSTACLFFQNPDDLGEFRRHGLIGADTRTVMTNGSGVNTEHYAAAPLPEEPAFLLIARLLKEKGILQYVEAARKVRRTHPDARFRLAGWADPGPDSISDTRLQSWVDEGLIDYLGPLDDVRPALAACRIYVLPSYREGTPRTVLEALATGRPVITTNAPGCRETVQPGVNGLLVRPRDSEDLARAMLELLESPTTAEGMARESRRIAEEKYDVHKVNRVILDAMGL